jgi:hypothetical protein
VQPAKKHYGLPQRLRFQRAIESAIETVDRLYPELEQTDSMTWQKLSETELGIYAPEGEELNDPRFKAALETGRRIQAPVFPRGLGNGASELELRPD